MNINFVNSELLSLEEMQAQVPVSLWSQYSCQLINTYPCFTLLST